MNIKDQLKILDRKSASSFPFHILSKSPRILTFDYITGSSSKQENKLSLLLSSPIRVEKDKEVKKSYGYWSNLLKTPTEFIYYYNI